MRSTPACVLVLLLVGPSCHTYKVTKTTAPGASKAADCDFVVATKKVARDYEEMAILDKNTGGPSDVLPLKDAGDADVCALGGDAEIDA